MQQTTKYQFNLIESSDAFSAAPLNANAQITEEVLSNLEGHTKSTENPHGVTAAQINAVAVGTDAILNTLGSKENATEGGTFVGLKYSNALEHGLGSIRGQNTIALYKSCTHTNKAKAAALGQSGFIYPSGNTYKAFPAAIVFEQRTSEPVLYKSQKGYATYSQDEFLTMDTFPLLHTGNAESNGIGRIANGSYTGTGTYGADNPCTLTFPFAPKFVAIAPSMNTTAGGAFFINGQSASGGVGNTGTGSSCNDLVVSWENKSVIWYTQSSSSTNAEKQFNLSGYTYYWFAVG